MLGGDDDVGDAHRLVILVLHGNPALRVGAQPLDAAGFAGCASVRGPSWCAYMMGAGINSGVSVQA